MYPRSRAPTGSIDSDGSVKLETVGIEERQSVKDVLSRLDGDNVFNEAVAALYQPAEVLGVEGPCFKCHKSGHVASDCVQQRKPPTCYRSNKVGHIAPKYRARDVYCTICRNLGHVTEACFTEQAPRTTVATAGYAPRINATQEMDRQADRAFSGSEELWSVSQRMTGSAFATAAVSTSASGSNNFSP